MCANCISMERLSAGRRSGELVPPGDDPDVAMCERCGRPLEKDLLVRMATKLHQLGRFGLAGRPLLSRRKA